MARSSRPFQTDGETPFRRASDLYQYVIQNIHDCFDLTVASSLSLLSASVSPSDPNIAYTTWSLTVPATLCNRGGNLHGGAVATIFDLCTSLTITAASRPGFWDGPHVSRTLNTTYLRPVPEGAHLLVEAEVVHLGKRMAMTKGLIKTKDSGKVCYTCEHNKVNLAEGKL